MRNVKFSAQDFTVFPFVICLPEVRVDVMDGRGFVLPFPDQPSIFDLREHRIPVILGVGKSSVVKQRASVRLALTPRQGGSFLALAESRHPNRTRR